MEKVAGIQSDTIKALKKAHQAHQVSSAGMFGLDVLGDILLVCMGQFCKSKAEEGADRRREL